MGVSDRHYFAWLRDALAQFEAESGQLAAMRRRAEPLELWVLAGPRLNPSVEFVLDALGPENTTVRLLDKFARLPGVIPLDFNALEEVGENSCDFLMMTRASYMVENPPAFLFHLRRIIRPGGLAIVDWLHGASDAPLLHLPGNHEYEGRRYPFLTTYCDAAFLSEFRGEFEAFLKHVNRPPWWARFDRRDAPRLPGRLFSRRPQRRVTIAAYLDTLREALGRLGKHLVGPELLEQHFKVVFRHARYLCPFVRKFHLYLLNVLRPGAKEN